MHLVFDKFFERKRQASQKRSFANYTGTEFLIELFAQIDSKMTACCHIMKPTLKQSLSGMPVTREKVGTTPCFEDGISAFFVFYMCDVVQYENDVLWLMFDFLWFNFVHFQQ